MNTNPFTAPTPPAAPAAITHDQGVAQVAAVFNTQNSNAARGLLNAYNNLRKWWTMGGRVAGMPAGDSVAAAEVQTALTAANAATPVAGPSTTQAAIVAILTKTYLANCAAVLGLASPVTDDVPVATVTLPDAVGGGAPALPSGSQAIA